MINRNRQSTVVVCSSRFPRKQVKTETALDGQALPPHIRGYDELTV
jgi:hypothetical protein